MIVKGALLATATLLYIQHITSFASLIRAGAHVESSLQSGHFPALSALARQANSTNNHRSSNSSNNSTFDCSEQHAVTCADPLEVPAFAES